jgi:16S rRNA processing protein RimM
MEYIKIGKIVNTHALKGEVRILSNFEYKNQVFILNNHLFIGRNKVEEIIETYRKHKNYDMVKFKGKDYINDVLLYKGEPVYVLRDSLSLNDNEVLIEDLINMEVIYNNESIGLIEDYRNDNGNRLIFINGKYIPYNKDFIEKIDKLNKKIYYKNIDAFL